MRSMLTRLVGCGRLRPAEWAASDARSAADAAGDWSAVSERPATATSLAAHTSSMAGKPSSTFYNRLAARKVFCSVLVMVVVLASGLTGAAAPKYPTPVGNINDFSGVLTADDEANLNALVASVLEQTGVTFAVAIVDNTGGESLEFYAANLYEEWGIGEKGKDEGLLILLVMEDRTLKAEVGYGLEPVITDRRAGECLDLMLPYFREGEYGKGLYAGLMRAAEYVAKDRGITLEVKPVTEDYGDVYTGAPDPSSLAWLGLLLGAPMALVGLLIWRGNRCPRCKARLNVVDRVIQQATYQVGGIAAKVYHCARCGYHAEKTYRTGPLSRTGTGGIPMGPGPFFGGGFWGRGGSGRGGGFSGPRGFGGGRSGGGGASRKW